MSEVAQPHGPETMDDEDAVLELFEIADELTRIHTRTGELSIRLDRLAGLIGERWAPSALERLDDRDAQDARL